MKKYMFLLLAIAMSGVSLSAQYNLCKSPDISPDIFNGVDRYMQRHFKYPVDAYQYHKKNKIPLELIITKEGKMVDCRCMNNTHPSLEKELSRVLAEAKWSPAKKDGNPVDSKYTIYLDLTDKDRIPYGLKYIMQDADKAIARINETLPPAKELESICNAIEEAGKTFVNFPKYPIAYAGLQNSVGKSENVVGVMDSCWKEYHWIPDEITDRFRREGTTFDNGPYKGRTEILVALMRAMQHQYHETEKTDSAYLDANALIDLRISDNYLLEPSAGEKEMYEAERRLRRLERDMVNEYTRSNKVGVNTNGHEQIGRDYNLDQAAGTLIHFSDEGLVNNAQVAQISKMIRDEFEDMGSSKIAKSKSQLNLFGAKAFALWIQYGDNVFESYLARIRGGEPSKQLLKYIDKMEKNKAKNAELLADRQAVLQSLVCLAPTADTPEAEVKAFHARRKAVADVFPLRWLAK